jgi:hypothetical protein
VKNKRPLRYAPHYLARLRDTRAGIAAFGLFGAGAFALLGAAMHNYRSLCEPILKVFLMAVRRGSSHPYDPSDYFFWAWVPLLFAALWLATCLIVLANKSATDRRIDRGLRERLGQEARGAPLEPD